MAFLIEKLSERFFKFQKDAEQPRYEPAPTCTAIGNLIDFKTKNGANIQQQVLITEITVLDTYGSTGSFTFTDTITLFEKLFDLGFFWWAQSGTGGGATRFDNLADTFSYFGNNGKVPVVNSALNKLIPTTFYNVQKSTDLSDFPSALVADKMLVVNSAGTGFVFIDPPTGTGDPFLNAYGWEIYKDTGATVTYTGATDPYYLLNDSDEIVDTYKPFGIGNSYDGVNNAFDFSAYSLGDIVKVKVFLKLESSVINQSALFKLKKAIGSASEEEVDVFEHEIIHSIPNVVQFDFNVLLDNNDVRINPSKLMLFSTDDLDITIDRYEIEGVRKNVNITSITAIDDTASHLKGEYDILTNTPPLADGVGQIGEHRILTTAGTRDFGSGNKTFGIDDIIMYNGSIWFKAVDNNQSGGGGGGAVDSVDGLTGVLTTGQIVNSLTEKVTVVDNDLVGGADSEASNVSKKWKFSTIATYVLGKLGATLWALTPKTTPVDADTITINDTEDGNNLKKVSLLNLWTNYLKAKADLLYQAILTDVNFGSFSNSLTSKTTPVGADSINIVDSEDSNKSKKLSFTNLVSFLGNYFATTSNVLKVRWRARGDGSIDVLGSTLPTTTGTHMGLTSSGNAAYDALLNRSRYKSASTAGSSCGFRDSSYRYYNFTKGFKITFIFVISDDTYVTGSRLFCGLYESGSVIGNVEPSTLSSIISIGKDSSDTNLQVIHNNGGASTKVDLGSNFPANTTFADMYKVTFEANAGGTSVNYTVKRFGTAFTATGTISTNINTSGSFAPHLWRNNGATASPVALTLYDLDADIKLD